MIYFWLWVIWWLELEDRLEIDYDLFIWKMIVKYNKWLMSMGWWIVEYYMNVWCVYNWPLKWCAIFLSVFRSTIYPYSLSGVFYDDPINIIIIDNPI